MCVDVICSYGVWYYISNLINILIIIAHLMNLMIILNAIYRFISYSIYLLKMNLLYLNCLPDFIKYDKEFILQFFFSDNKYILDRYYVDIINNKKFMLDLIKDNGCFLVYASDEIKNDRSLVLEAIKNGLSLEKVSDEFKNDKEIVLTAINNGGFYCDASDNMQNDKEIALAAIKNGESVYFLSDNFKDDIDIALAAVKNKSDDLDYLSDNIKNNKEVVLESVNSDGRTIIYASINLKHDKEILIAAIKNRKSYKDLELETTQLKDTDVYLLYFGYLNIVNPRFNILKDIEINFI